MRILVVDDEKTLVKGMKFNLENEGYEVECAYDGAAALELAREGRFDLIILDVMMPEMDGLEACMKIREFSNVPIIMLTAKSEDADKLMGFECGADDYLTKLNIISAIIAVATISKLLSSDALAAVVAFNPNIKQIGAAMSKSIIATVYGNSDFVSFNSFVSVFLILRTSAIIIIPIPAPT